MVGSSGLFESKCLEVAKLLVVAVYGFEVLFFEGLEKINLTMS